MILVVCLLLLGMSSIDRIAMAGNEKELFRVGFSKSTFSNINENDAVAALKVSFDTVTKELDIATEPVTRTYNDVQTMKQDLLDKKVDSLALTATEYLNLRHFLDDNCFIVATNGRYSRNEYILLVHRDGKIQNLKDLQGAKLGIFTFGLARIWLDTILMGEQHPPASRFCQAKEYDDVSQAVLPVFFRRIDACVVDRNGFQTMCELNPQLSHQLKILASSPTLTSFSLAFRRGYESRLRQLLTDQNGFNRLLSSKAGQQIMTLFHISGFEARSASCMKSAVKMLTRHEQLFKNYKRHYIKKP
ncbi:phosphate/phosphite/phosphonate ABC transporter substrate-binding protein [Syntrophotalea carbinolica]|nr:PhnD/SsuA/transferrin family substrate-binding protein [Syntrophotalea carbinolica]